MHYTSIRQFYLENVNPDSCTYCQFTRKMNKLAQKMGEKSGIQKVSSTFILVDTTKSELYKPLLSKRNTHF